jgi:hypothetical protein
MQLGVGGSFEGGTPTMGQKNISSSQMHSSNRKRRCLLVFVAVIALIVVTFRHANRDRGPPAALPHVEHDGTECAE